MSLGQPVQRATLEDATEQCRREPMMFAIAFAKAVNDYVFLKWVGLPIAFVLGLLAGMWF